MNAQVGEPALLWLLVAPAALLVVLLWRFARRGIELGRIVARGPSPVRQRFRLAGDLPFWCCLIGASACFVIALARPQAPFVTPRPAGVDIVVLQDASASMRVSDVVPVVMRVGASAPTAARSAASARLSGLKPGPSEEVMRVSGLKPRPPQVIRVSGLKPGLADEVMRPAEEVTRVGALAPTAARSAALDRWQRSMLFLRRLGDALSWRDDRIAMAVFAHIATPQIRLTRDPNTFFFFLDHLHARPPFRLEDETTWDTNLELAIDWGLRMIAKDEEVRGRSPNAKVFVMLSDGESWSGEVAKSLARATEQGIPLFVIGVGTLSGGRLPMVRAADGTPIALDGPGVSRLDRASLQRIATAGAGQYFELDRDGDAEIANTIVSAARRLAPPLATPQGAEELYWLFLSGGGLLAALGVVFMRDRIELMWILAGLVATGLAFG